MVFSRKFGSTTENGLKHIYLGAERAVLTSWTPPPLSGSSTACEPLHHCSMRANKVTKTCRRFYTLEMMMMMMMMKYFIVQ